MPKQYIDNRFYGQSARQLDFDEDGKEIGSHMVPLDDSAVKVGWTKDHEHVEIAIVKNRDRATGEPPADSEAWHSQFDRAGLNRLIRALRKARDDAFGSDA